MSGTGEAREPVDCLVVGYYDWDFSRVVEMTKAMGVDSGAYRDLRLAYVELEGRPYRAMDLINHHRFANGADHTLYHNYDFLWPAVGYLVTYLHRRGLRAEYVNLPHLEWDAFREKLLRAPRCVAITTTHVITPEPAKELLKFIRLHAPNTKVVVGGPFVYNQANTLEAPELQASLSYLDADIYVISREGEGTLARVVQALKDNQDLASIPNLAFRADRRGSRAPEGDRVSERLHSFLKLHPDQRAALRTRVRVASTRSDRFSYELTGDEAEDHDLVENRIDYDLFPRKDVGSFVSLWTSKSCPFACSFCGFPARSGPYRYLSVEDLARDLDRLHELGVTNLTFIDDTFNVPKERFKRLLRWMIERKYGFQWNCFYRCDHGDAETVELMRQAGCAAVFLGVESGSDAILGRMNKTARRRDYLCAIPMLRDSGILTHANIIVGFPGETDDTVRESIDLIEQTRPHTYRAQLWYCDPMTPIYKDRDKVGLKGQSFNWRHDTMDAPRAADWVDELFRCVNNSNWLPQHSFEQWSILYLESKGVKRQAIFDYIRRFNSIIKAGLGGAGACAPAAVEHAGIETLVREAFCAAPSVGAGARVP